MIETATILETRTEADNLLSDEHAWEEGILPGEALTFHTPEQHDVYNITAPFLHDGKKTILGRSEDRVDEVNTVTRFFVEDEQGGWLYDESRPPLDMQDPHVTKVQEQWVVCGVRVVGSLTNPEAVERAETVFLWGDDMDHLAEQTTVPDMKDVRLVDLPDGRLLVFTRPQDISQFTTSTHAKEHHNTGGKGTIGFKIVDSLEAFKAMDKEVFWDENSLLRDMFADGEWGGVNAAYQLANGKIGALGHVARWVNGVREYYPMSFVLDPDTGEVSQQQILCDPDDFPPVPPKKDDLQRVLFSGGFEITDDDQETLIWYGGKSDTSAVRMRMRNPFGAKIVQPTLREAKPLAA